MIFNMVCGTGGGEELNFKVVGNPRPENVEENTVWIDTDTEITSWIFSATEPEIANEGLVWFQLSDTKSFDEFNILKKNVIMAYPKNIKQYVNGTWVDKTTKRYHDGVWIDWITDFILIGSSVRSGYGYSEARSTTVSVHSTYVSTSWDGGNGSTTDFYWSGIDVTDYNTMTVYIYMEGDSASFYVGSSEITVYSSGRYKIDISNMTGAQRIGFDTYEVDYCSVSDWRLTY